MRISFTPDALEDLRAVRDWIAQDDARIADRIISRIRQTISIFGQFPMLGHEGIVAGTREFKVTGLPYLVIYRIASSTEIDILNIVHTRRQYPPTSD